MIFINSSSFKKVLEIIKNYFSKSNKIIFVNEIGRGGYSKVYEIIYKNYYFVGKLQILDVDMENLKKKEKFIEDEKNLMIKLKNNNIIKILYAFKNDNLAVKSKKQKNKKILFRMKMKKK